MQILPPEAAIIGIVLAIIVSIVIFSMLMCAEALDRVTLSKKGALCLSTIGLVVGILLIISSPDLWTGWVLAGICLVTFYLEIACESSDSQKITMEDGQMYYEGDN